MDASTVSTHLTDGWDETTTSSNRSYVNAPKPRYGLLVGFVTWYRTIEQDGRYSAQSPMLCTLRGLPVFIARGTLGARGSDIRPATCAA